MDVNDETTPVPPPAPVGARPRPTYVLTRWLFLRLLGVAYFCAFASLGPQVRGLIGSHGILPAAEFLRGLYVGPERRRSGSRLRCSGWMRATPR